MGPPAGGAPIIRPSEAVRHAGAQHRVELVIGQLVRQARFLDGDIAREHRADCLRGAAASADQVDLALALVERAEVGAEVPALVRRQGIAPADAEIRRGLAEVDIAVERADIGHAVALAVDEVPAGAVRARLGGHFVAVVDHAGGEAEPGIAERIPVEQRVERLQPGVAIVLEASRTLVEVVLVIVDAEAAIERALHRYDQVNAGAGRAQAGRDGHADFGVGGCGGA